MEMDRRRNDLQKKFDALEEEKVVVASPFCYHSWRAPPVESISPTSFL